MDEDVCLLIVACFVTAVALALSFTGARKTDASAIQASPVTGIFALLMRLFPLVLACARAGRIHHADGTEAGLSDSDRS